MFLERWNQELGKQKISRALSWSHLPRQHIISYYWLLRDVCKHQQNSLNPLYPSLLSTWILELKWQTSAAALLSAAWALDLFAFSLLSRLTGRKKAAFQPLHRNLPHPPSRFFTFPLQMKGLGSTVWKQQSWEEKGYLQGSKNANPEWSGSPEFVYLSWLPLKGLPFSKWKGFWYF